MFVCDCCFFFDLCVLHLGFFCKWWIPSASWQIASWNHKQLLQWSTLIETGAGQKIAMIFYLWNTQHLSQPHPTTIDKKHWTLLTKKTTCFFQALSYQYHVKMVFFDKRAQRINSWHIDPRDRRAPVTKSEGIDVVFEAFLGDFGAPFRRAF